MCIRDSFVPSRVSMSTNLGRGLSSSLERMGRKVLPGIGQRVVLAEAVEKGLTIAEYAPSSVAHEEFHALAKAGDKILRKGWNDFCRVAWIGKGLHPPCRSAPPPR